MSYSGKIREIFSVYGIVFIAVILVQFIVILLEYFAASIYSKKRVTVLEFIKNQVPSYLTATVHFAGSSIAIRMFAVAVIMMNSLTISFGTMVEVIVDYKARKLGLISEED